MAKVISTNGSGPEDQSKVQQIYGPECKVSPKDQPKGTWREAQAASYLGMQVGTLRQWRFKSVGPVYLKIGRAVRYRQEDLDAYLEKVSVNPVA